MELTSTHNDAYIRIPKKLFMGEYANISAESRELYGFIADRIPLSEANGWFDEKGRPYVIFTIEEIKRIFSCANRTAVKVLKELERANLIERKKKGQGKATHIFLKREFKYSKKENSRTSKSEIPEFQKVQGNNNNYNNNNSNNNNSINKSEGESSSVCLKREEYRAELRGNIDYESLAGSVDRVWLDSTVELMLDVVCSSAEYVKINSESIPTQLVKDRYLSLNKEHIKAVLSNLEELETQPRNMRGYMLSALYNSTLTYFPHVSHESTTSVDFDEFFEIAVRASQRER